MTYDQQSDEQLVSACSRADHQALTELVRRYQRKALGLAFRLLGSPDAAEDVAQEAFLRVYQGARHYKPTARFGTWFYRIVVNLCTDRLRLRQRSHQVPIEDIDPVAGRQDTDPSQASLTAERRQAVRKALAGLPDRQRVAVTLHRFEGLSHKEISVVLDTTPSAVESLLVRAYHQLRQDLTEFRDSS